MKHGTDLTNSPTLDYRPITPRAKWSFGPLALSIVSLLTAFLPFILVYNFRLLMGWEDLVGLALVVVPLSSIFLAAAAIRWGKQEKQRAPRVVATWAIAISAVNFLIFVLGYVLLSNISLHPN